MKHRILLIVTMLIAMTTGAEAKVPEALERLFGGPYRDNPAATETIITGEPLKTYNLSMFHSLQLKGDSSLADTVEQAVKKAGSRAKWKETVFKAGRLQNGIYELEGNAPRRYILYLNTFLTGGDDVTVIYLEGKAEPSMIKKLITTISN